MKYHEIEPMCKPFGGVRGCPHDGLGCTGGTECSINSSDRKVAYAAYTAHEFGPAFRCAKRERFINAEAQRK